MRPGTNSAARFGGLSRSATHRADARDDRWPLFATVSFVVAFNIVAWGTIALGLYAIL
jgi:hypothetical protein